MTNKANTGDANAGDANAGNQNTGNQNTGDANPGHLNAGNQNTGNQNTGDLNTGHRNTGYRNTGYRNTGNSNTGNSNTGHLNAGDRNTGTQNTGDSNTGNWNTCDRESGFFNTAQAPTVRVFNTTVSRSVWNEFELPGFLFFGLTEWVWSKNMTDDEKAAHPTHQTTGGYLKEYEYKEAFQKSWREADPVDRARIKDAPGFDADVFYEISGIRVDEPAVKEMTVAEIAEALGYDVRVVK
jgi:hypothetical protein